MRQDPALPVESALGGLRALLRKASVELRPDLLGGSPRAFAVASATRKTDCSRAAANWAWVIQGVRAMNP
jgi:hypothetical protein